MLLAEKSFCPVLMDKTSSSLCQALEITLSRELAMFPHPRQPGILLSRKENRDPSKLPVSLGPREASGPGEWH